MIKRTLVFLITLVTIITIAACQSPALSPSLSVSSTPIQSAAPSASPNPEFTFASPKPSPMVTPEPDLPDEGILGEWAGYISLAESDFLFSSPLYEYKGTKTTYAAKLTITENGAWLSLDMLGAGQDFSENSPKLLASAGNFGVNLSISELGEAFVSLKIEDYAYASQQSVPFQTGRDIALSYHHLTTWEERDDPEVFKRSPAYVPEASGDMLYGKMGVWTVSFSRLSESSSPAYTYPRWNGAFTNLAKNVRGAYSFGEMGADNGFSSCVFVYHDDSGFEHIRFLFGDIYVPMKQEPSGDGYFINNTPLDELGVSFSATPWWATLYMLNTHTGEVIDVSARHKDFYRDEELPYAKRALLLDLYAGGEGQQTPNPTELAADKEYYFRVYEAAYGKLPEALPELKPPVVNSKAVYADIDNDGDEDKIEMMFFNSIDENAQSYDAAWFCINGVWRYNVFPGNSVYEDFILPDFAVVSLDGSSVVIALEDASASSPSVSLYQFFSGGSMAYVCNNTLWGRVVSDSDDLRVAFHGDGSATGLRRSVFSGDIVVTFAYSSEGGFLNRDRPEDNLYEAESAKALILAEPLYAYLEQDTSSQAISLFSGQQVLPIASDEVAWLKMRTASGQVFWVHCKSEDDFPKFK